MVVESAGKMYALAIVLGLLAIAATILRFYARRIKQASLSWDDYMILPALVCRAAFNVANRKIYPDCSFSQLERPSAWSLVRMSDFRIERMISDLWQVLQLAIWDSIRESEKMACQSLIID